jgi:hypothetical protein
MRHRTVGGGSLDDAGWLNDPVPVPVPLLVELLPFVSRERGGRMQRRCTTLAPGVAVESGV